MESQAHLNWAPNQVKTAKPRRTQAQRTADTRARLLEATIESLSERGYSATSTALVAKMAGVSRGTMLHHFASKAALMAGVVRATYDADIVAYTAVMKDLRDGKDALNNLIDTAWTCFNSPGGIAQTEIWLAVRSDKELAGAVLPLRNDIDTNSARVLSSVLKRYGFQIGVSVEGVLCYVIGALRGLSIQKVLGCSPEDLAIGVAILKRLPELTKQSPTKAP